MSFKPQPPRPIPEDLARIGAKLLPADSPYRLIGDRLYAQYDEADFADLYSAEGKPAISPVLLSFVTAFQFMENLPDRAAAEALRVRMDWKYALPLPLDYAGFDFSVLSAFRERLIEHQAEARVFEQLLHQLQALGLIKRRGRQRSDSLAVLTKVRELSRLELVVETLRLALRAVLKQAPEWTQACVPPTWEARYGERCVAERLSEDVRASLVAEVGPDGQWLLERLQAESTPPKLCELAEVQLLAAVWEQQFEVVKGQVVFTTGGAYEGKTRIQSPHDPEARYSQKGEQSWIGDKVQVTETDDEGLPHLITDMAFTSSVETDYEALDDIQARLVARDLTPGEHCTDGGYMSGPNLVASAQRGIDLIGPVATLSSPQVRLPDGITADQFQLDEEAQVAICPAGQCSQRGIVRDEGRVFRFPRKVCAACPLRPRCCSGQGEHSLFIHHHHAVLQAARARQQTEEFKASYRQHRGGVEGCLSALVRGHGLRVGRYIGRAKRHLQALFTGVAANLRRAARWLAGGRAQRRRKGLELAPAAT
jgi:transposase